MKKRSLVLSFILVACLALAGLIQPIFAADPSNQTGGSTAYDDPTIEVDDLELYDIIGNDAMSHTANVDLKTMVPATIDIQVIGGGSVRHGDRAYHGSAHIQTTYMKFQIVPDDGHVLQQVLWNGYDITKHINRGFLSFQDLEDGVLVAIFKEMKVKELPCPMADDCCCKAGGKCCKDMKPCKGGPAKCCGVPCGKGPCKGECCAFKGPKVQTADHRDELMLGSLVVLVTCAGLFTLTYIRKAKKHLFRKPGKYLLAKK